MLPLPAFRLHRPRSIEEAARLLQSLGPEATLVAGGTDLIPNMKRGLLAPPDVISLAGVAGLQGIREEDGALRIGATTTLAEIARHPALMTGARALAEAAAAVGGPHHRRMGTIGGNLCLDTRCRYYDQTFFWRSALGFCLKKDGDTCHVVAGGRRCVAAASNDTAAAVLALGADIELVSAGGARTVAARDFYTADGVWNTVRARDEIVVGLRVPLRAGRASAYRKLRRRGAIDFPLLSVAARADVEGEMVTGCELVVSALAARPRRIRCAAELAVAKRPHLVPRDEIADGAFRECTPLPNVEGDVAWRKEMVRTLTARALLAIGLGPA